MDRRRGVTIGEECRKSIDRNAGSGGSGGNNEPIEVSNYLTIYALENGLEVKISESGLSYNINNSEWVEYPKGKYTPSINNGDYIMFKGGMANTSGSSSTFTITKRCKLTGNCGSLYFGDNAAKQKSLSGYDYAFRSLFEDCSTIEEVSDDFLPATTLSTGCYESMFAGCTKLIKGPNLPSTNVPYRGYWLMFDGCTKLIESPKIFASYVGYAGCNYMFSGCTSLAIAPELPAETLSTYSYSNMFYGCTGLTTPPPILPAINLTASCYEKMFYGCISLTTPPKLVSTSLNSNSYKSMFEGCVNLTTAPELLADKIYSSNYKQMFKGCSKLSYIKMLATYTSTSDNFTEWVSGVSPTGIFVKHPDMTSLPTGDNGIPSGWIVYNDGEEPQPQVAGDVAYYTNGEIKTISSSKWNSSLGTPIGVVVIPSNFLPDGKARILSLNAVDSNGNATTSHMYMTWGVYGTDTTLTNYNRVPLTNNTGSISTSSASYGYLPSDNFTGDTSFVDGGAKYDVNYTNKIPSPYNGSEFNTDYSKIISSYNNALSDFNGLSNTQTLVGLDSDYTAANAAWNYNDGVSNTQWYLPSAGELGFLVARFKTINNTISQLGGIAVLSNFFWSSTEYSSSSAFYVYTHNGNVHNDEKAVSSYVRPFAMI